MIAQKNGPLAGRWNIRRLAHDFHDGMAVFLGDGHIHARHQRKMVGHVALIAFTEVIAHIFRPLIGFGEKHAILVMLIDHGAHLFDHGMRFGQVFVLGALAHTQVGNRIQAHPVHALVEPETHQLDDCLHHLRVIVVEVGLMGEETMPVISLRFLIPGPVGFLRIGKDDARLGKFQVAITPHVKITFAGTGWCPACCLKPRMLIRGVINDQLGDDLEAASMGFLHELLEIGHGAIVGMDVVIIRDVIPVVAHRRRVEGEQPERVHPQILEIIELLDQSAKIADTIIVAVKKSLDVQLVNHRIFIPERILHPLRIVPGRFFNLAGFFFAHGHFLQKIIEVALGTYTTT